jgi:hypothetical protein
MDTCLVFISNWKFGWGGFSVPVRLFIGCFIKNKKSLHGLNFTGSSRFLTDPVGQAGFVKPITGLIFNWYRSSQRPHVTKQITKKKKKQIKNKTWSLDALSYHITAKGHMSPNKHNHYNNIMWRQRIPMGSKTWCPFLPHHN